MTTVTQRQPHKVESEWISDAERQAMDMADIDDDVATHNRRVYETMERREKQARINEQMADQVYDKVKKYKGLIKKKLRKKIAEQVVLANAEAHGEDVDPESLMTPEELMMMVGEASMIMEQLDEQQRAIV